MNVNLFLASLFGNLSEKHSNITSLFVYLKTDGANIKTLETFIHNFSGSFQNVISDKVLVSTKFLVNEFFKRPGNALQIFC